MLLVTLGASLLGNMLSGKGILRAGYGNKKNFNSASSFSNHWNTRVLPEWTKLNGVYSTHNLPKKIKDGGIYNKSWWICRCW